MAEGHGTVSFDVDAAVAAIRDAVDDEDVHVVAAFTPDTYELLSVDERTRSRYTEEAAMRAHFDRIHEYAGIDFSEIGLFVDDLFPVADGVEYIATGMDYLTLVRVFVGTEGLLLSLAPRVDVAPVVEAVDGAVDADLGSAGDSIGDTAF
ncbi:hypothetical protein [Halobaculum lipolyticum]|uniref:Uncharacterized protein n=1 Tax=Halobaculum lipolyticum TaxID=3032001 RepID=A0ABD5WC58_9EURY|nr:hypothetical protein [Halobaculum sp. DT31]